MSRFLKLCRKHFLLRLWTFLCLGAQNTVHELLKIVCELFVEISTFKLKTEILTVSKVLNWNSCQLQAAYINIKMDFHIQNRRLFSDVFLWSFKKSKTSLEISMDTEFSALVSQIRFCKDQSSEKSAYVVSNFSKISIFYRYEFSAKFGVVWSENLLKKWKKLRTFEMLQNRFWRLF